MARIEKVDFNPLDHIQEVEHRYEAQITSWKKWKEHNNLGKINLNTLKTYAKEML